jgi:dipeptidyl aminopeptidase/acylaminoacyl peptidase
MRGRRKRRITAEDLYKFRLVSGCEISPDGRHVVFEVQRVDRKTEKRYSNLWLAQTGGGRAREFTCGDQVDTQPRWSPDGRRIAFLSNRADEKQPQIYVLPFDGGEARRLTDMKGTFREFEWSPDGARLLCVFRKKDKEALEREKDGSKKKLGVVSRQITRVFYKLDNEGFLPKERWHIWVMDARTGRGAQLSDSPVHDELYASWSPDGEWVVFCSNRTKDPDLDPEAVDLFVVSRDGGEPRRIETPEGDTYLPRFSPDGGRIAYYGREGKGQWWRNTGLWVVPSDGKGKARNLTEPFDFEVAGSTINDMPGTDGLSPPVWSADGNRLYFPMARHGSTFVMAISADGDPSSLETLVDDVAVARSFRMDRDRSRAAYCRADLENPGQVFVLDLATRRSRKLTDVNGNLLRALDLGAVEEVWITGTGGNRLQGWVLKPPGFDASQRYPSILEIHGGPQVQYGNIFMHEFYFLAANGYVVYFCNPRGSQGYGEEHTKAIWNNWGTVDYEDLMMWADYVEGKPYIDSERMGVTGGSYGGYMTNWIIGNTRRFRAAVTQRSVSNFVSMYGSSDLNWIFQQELGDKPPWEDLENYWRQSPMKHIGEVRTPTLVIHSEQDLRCATEQGEQVYIALRKLGVDTELLLFPDEPHGLSRTGRTDRRIERLKHILRWFDTYLKEGS